MILRASILWIVMSMSITIGFAAQLKELQIISSAHTTDLFFAVNGAFTHKLFTLTAPNRVVIDLHHVALTININHLALQHSLIRQVRSGVLKDNTLRLVFDTTHVVHVHSLPWRVNGHIKGIKIQFQLAKESNASNNKKILNTGYNQKKSPGFMVKPPGPMLHFKPVVPIKISNSPLRSLRDVIIVLDAGHGGKDPGAHGPRNTKEKNIVLAITLKLKKLIDKQPGMRAVLTRSGDYYIGLRQRLDKARQYNGDIFVSIHADAFNNPLSNGASVFALSQRGATSEAARWIAEKENYSELGGVNLGDLDDTNGVVRSVLIDLSQTATINSSLQMGSQVLKELDKFTNLHNNKVEQARFMVLKSPDIPSILVETGFISNPVEERNLSSNAYQDRLCHAIFQGIKQFFWANPPYNTRIETMTTNTVHFVKNGETIGHIATRYGISVVALEQMNHINARTRLKPGQQLVIPKKWA